MGWKASSIIISPLSATDNEKLLNELGFINLLKIEDEPFEVAIYPDDNKVYIGTYKNNLIISAPDLPLTFFEDELTPAEKTLIAHFPNTEICSIVLHSAVNFWGYSLAKNGIKIRARAGSSDDGTFVDFGEPLEEEKELLSKSTVDNEGNRTYLLDDFPNEPFTEDAVGENFVFEISSRFFGVPLDRADDLLFETTLTGYSYTMISKPSVAKKIEEKTTEQKPWWKLW